MPDRRAGVDRIVRALLYEGYILYPYRPSALKNRHRWTFGGLFPEPYALTHGEVSGMQVECVLCGSEETTLCVTIRFLQAQFAEEHATPPSAEEPWREAIEQEISLPDLTIRELLAAPRGLRFSVPAARESVAAGHGDPVIRERAPLDGHVEVTAARGPGDVGLKLRVRVDNLTRLDPSHADYREGAARRAFHSTHVVLNVRDGAFISLADPPAELRALAAACENRGAWPILVGERGARDTVLASPMILEDWPEVAPESPGDLFDATEIDEILTLRILTLTDDEKRELRAADPRACAILERTEALSSDDLLRLHGALRRIEPACAPAATMLGQGSRVRIRPRHRADAMDVLLAGKIATVASVEEDVDGRRHYVVTIDEDPGRDLGPFAHRFFFRADELELLADEEVSG